MEIGGQRQSCKILSVVLPDLIAQKGVSYVPTCGRLLSEIVSLRCVYMCFLIVRLGA